jgi:hypothetical protein
LRNTQKSFAKFGGVLSQNDQEIADRVFREAEEASSAEGKETINKALNALERVAAQLTTAMMDPGTDTNGDKPAGEFTKF